MTDQVLDILKLVLLALLYLFFARVLWAVWSEVRATGNPRAVTEHAVPQASAPTPTPAGGVAAPAARRTPKPARGRAETPARLVVIDPKERRGAVFPITPGGVGIGREADNTIVITDDAYISGHHAKVSANAEGVVIDDLGSRNGTFLNGTRLGQQHKVRIGDRIQIGYTVLEAQ